MCLDTLVDWLSEDDIDFARFRMINNLEAEDNSWFLHRARFLHRTGYLSQTTWRHTPKFTTARTRILVLNCTAESLHVAPHALEFYRK